MTTKEREKVVSKLREVEVSKMVSDELLQRFKVRETLGKNVPTRDGETHVFIHYPNVESDEPLPLFVNIHGGGFVKEHRPRDIVFCKNICSNIECVVIDIDYVPAPEQKYPYALHQCYDVVKWAVENHEELNIDPSRLVLTGHSAGGNMVAGIALMNRDNKDFDISLQILDYPPLDLYTPPQLKRNAYKNAAMSPEKASIYNNLYVDAESTLLPTVSPLYAPDEMLLGLPEALIITCGDDALGEETEKYTYRLIQAGVTVTARRFLHSSHGFVMSRKDEYDEAEKLIFDALRRVYSK
ncbi:MAG: alpha/beta hydrolase [Lachnospiraceae bacterium]